MRKIIILLNSIIALSLLISLGGCNRDTTNESKSEFNREYFKEREDVAIFFKVFEGKSYEEVESALWKHRDKYKGENGLVSVWYTLDDPPFIVFEDSDDMRLGGFTLRFIDGKLNKYDLDFR